VGIIETSLGRVPHAIIVGSSTNQQAVEQGDISVNAARCERITTSASRKNRPDMAAAPKINFNSMYFL